MAFNGSDPIDQLVLLPGWGMNTAVWNGFSAPGGWHTTLLDLPGHGTEPLPAGLDSIWSWADACLAAAPERAVWVGWSLGGLVAQAAALQAPERVAGLILITATPRFVQAVDWKPAMAEDTLAQFHDNLLADPSGTLQRFLALQVRGSDGARETLRILRDDLASHPAPDPQALAQGLDLLRDEDLRGRLPDIRCPALWLFGDHDALVPAAVGERIEVLMPGAQTCCIAGAAHAPHLSHPEQTRARIAAFLREVAG